MSYIVPQNKTAPLPTQLILEKFVNGFLNGYVVDNQYVSNIDEDEQVLPDFDFLISVWKTGVAHGRYYRFRRLN